MSGKIKLAAARAPGEQFHVHMNIFMKALPHAIHELISNTAGTTVKQCTIHQSNGVNPLWITTRKFNNEKDTKNWFEQTKRALHDLKSNAGYVEYEKVKSDRVHKQEYKKYQSVLDFPTLKTKKTSSPQSCDIHIFMPLDAKNDFLIQNLFAVGFYEVRTADEKIWTLLLSDSDKGEKFFATLKDYFANVGGITKIELEYVHCISATDGNFLREQVYN